MIETARLVLRPIVKEDARDIFAYAQNPDVGPDAGWMPHTSLFETKAIMEQVFLNQEDVFGVVEKATGRMIGTIGFTPDAMRKDDELRMLGYSIGKESWNKGYITEASMAMLEYAFEQKDYPIVSVTHYPYNIGSRRVIEKCGFRYEGTLRHAEKRYDGMVFDLSCYSMTKEEYRNDQIERKQHHGDADA